GGGGGGAGGPGGTATPTVIGEGGPGIYIGDIWGDDIGVDGWVGGGGAGGPSGSEGATFLQIAAGGVGGGGDSGQAGVDGTGGGGGATVVTTHPGGGHMPLLPRGRGGAGVAVVKYRITTAPPDQMPISQIVEGICARAGLTEDEIDVSDLEDRFIDGYLIARE